MTRVGDKTSTANSFYSKCTHIERVDEANYFIRPSNHFHPQ